MNCFLDYRITKEELTNIYKLNIDPIIVPKCDYVYNAIDGHVDIQLNIIDKNSREIIVQNSINNDFIKKLEEYKINFSFSKNSLGLSYPNNIILNGLILDEYFVHNLKYTDENLLDNVKDKKLINVKQGYTKCSVLPIGNKAIITSDKKIALSLKSEGFDTLILPSGDILLPDLNYGFIGGVGGMINSNTLALFGEISNYAFGNELYRFLYKYDIEPISLRKGKLIDRGSLFII